MTIYSTKKDILDAFVKGRSQQLDSLYKNRILETQPEAKVINEFEVANQNLKQFEHIVDAKKKEASDLLRVASKTIDHNESQKSKAEELKNIFLDY